MPEHLTDGQKGDVGHGCNVCPSDQAEDGSYKRTMLSGKEKASREHYRVTSTTTKIAQSENISRDTWACLITFRPRTAVWVIRYELE